MTSHKSHRLSRSIEMLIKNQWTLFAFGNRCFISAKPNHNKTKIDLVTIYNMLAVHHRQSWLLYFLYSAEKYCTELCYNKFYKKNELGFSHYAWKQLKVTCFHKYCKSEPSVTLLDPYSVWVHLIPHALYVRIISEGKQIYDFKHNVCSMRDFLQKWKL